MLKTKTEKKAYYLFSVVNSRGSPLSLYDNLKVKCLELVRKTKGEAQVRVCLLQCSFVSLGNAVKYGKHAKIH